KVAVLEESIAVPMADVPEVCVSRKVIEPCAPAAVGRVVVRRPLSFDAADGPGRVSAPGTGVPRPVMVARGAAEVSAGSRWLFVSARTRRFDDESVGARGELSAAWAAGPASPEKPWMPSPAIVEMIPLVASMRRMRWFAVSAM